MLKLEALRILPCTSKTRLSGKAFHNLGKRVDNGKAPLFSKATPTARNKTVVPFVFDFVVGLCFFISNFISSTHSTGRAHS